MDLGLLQKNVVDIIGVSECTVYDWENDGSQTATQYMPGIIDFLGYVPFECPEDILGKLDYFKRIRGLSLDELGSFMGRDPERLSDWLRCHKRPCQRNLESMQWAGLTLLVPKSRVEYLDISPDKALQFIVSTGITRKNKTNGKMAFLGA